MRDIPIHIDTQDLFADFSVSRRQVEDFLDVVAKEITGRIAFYWETQAKQKLKSTRSLYLQNLKVIDEGRMRGAIVLDYSKHPLVKMLEEGASPFDMKKGFEKSDKKKTKKDGGWYLHIPFRLAAPSSLGESSLFSGKMPQEVYEVVSKKPTQRPIPGGRVSKPLQLSEIPQKYRPPKVREKISIFSEYIHKTSIYEGLVKKKDTTTGQNIYMNFRTVSDKSDPGSWIHTGITAYNLSEKAIQSFESKGDRELSAAIDKGLTSLGLL